MFRHVVSRPWSTAALVLGLGFVACTEEEEPDLEEQIGDPGQREKQPCPELPASGYAVTPEFAESLRLEVVDCGLALPSRIRFAPSGEFFVVAQLKGVVEIFRREGEGFVADSKPLHDLGDLGVRDEAGLTALFFGADFDLDAEDAARRDLFLNYQKSIDGRNRNVIRRLTLARKGSAIAATDAVDIITFPDPTSQAHQIQDGFGLVHEGAPHILVAVGDNNTPSTARDPEDSNGSLHLLQRDGSEPLGQRPWSSSPSVVAIGLRNAYSVVRLPAEVDERRGVVGFENGISDNDRAWLIRPFPESGAPAQMDLGYEGNDDSQKWLAFEDLHTRGALGGNRTAVFMTFNPTISPTQAAIHPGGGPFADTRSGLANIVVAHFGKSGDGSLGPGKTLQMVTVSNISGAALQSDRVTIVQRRSETEGEFRHPVALDVDPTNGDIFFADIITGELARIDVLDD